MTDERIRAAIPMGVEGYALYGEQGLASIDIPVMILHATADEYNPYTFEPLPIFEALQTPEKVLISFIDLGHLMIFDEEPVRRMEHFAAAFFGYHLQGRNEYADYFSEKYVKKFDDLTWGVYEE
jgi:predicted dienelactone hydrolase